MILIKPIRANIEITNLCNLRCSHCYLYSENIEKVKHKELSFLRMKKIVNKLIKEGIFELSIGGGEPFCYKRIKDILLLSTSKMFTSVSSNGLLLDKSKISYLKKLVNFSLQISLDGKKKTHQNIRGINDTQYNNLVRNIELCSLNGIDIQIGFMLSHINISDVNYICKFCLSKKIKRLTILPYIGRKKELKLNSNDVYAFVNMIKKYTDNLTINIRDPFINFLVFKKKSYCEAGYLAFNIDSLGNVSPCCYLDFIVGNIFDLKIKDIPKICKSIIKAKDRKFCIANNPNFNLQY